MLLALDKWDGILRDYIEAGGRPPTFEEKRAALLKMLPNKFREDVFFRFPALHESYSNASADGQNFAYRTLRAQLQRQVDMILQWANIGNLPGGSHANILPEGTMDQQGGEQAGQDDPAYAAWKGKGKGKGKDGKGKAKGTDMKVCINCGGKDHTISECKKMLVPAKERPCLRCLQPGYIA